jgi:hypothetical protein
MRRGCLGWSVSHVSCSKSETPDTSTKEGTTRRCDRNEQREEYPVTTSLCLSSPGIPEKKACHRSGDDANEGAPAPFRTTMEFRTLRFSGGTARAEEQAEKRKMPREAAFW